MNYDEKRNPGPRSPAVQRRATSAMAAFLRCWKVMVGWWKKGLAGSRGGAAGCEGAAGLRGSGRMARGARGRCESNKKKSCKDCHQTQAPKVFYPKSLLRALFDRSPGGSPI